MSGNRSAQEAGDGGREGPRHRARPAGPCHGPRGAFYIWDLNALRPRKKKKKTRAVSGPNINTATSTRLASVERAGQVPYGLGGTRVSRTTALRSLPHLVPSRPTCRNFMEKTKSVSIRPPWLLKQPPDPPAAPRCPPVRPSSCCNAPRPAPQRASLHHVAL